MRRKLGGFLIAIVLVVAPGGPVRGDDDKAAAPAFKPEQIEQLVAPIALYPDDLVSQILMAATYPLEVVQAQRWGKANASLKGDALATALEKQPWDPSVKSLVNFPDVLAMMDGKLDWTQDLGDAFLAQQKDVMDAVQKLRKQAMDAGNLKPSEQQNVTTEESAIVITSTDPNVIYVPIYNPVVVYGTWPYPAYPPYYYYPPYYRPTPAPYAFVAGIAVGVAWGYAWGSCNWNHCNVNVDVNRNVNLNRNINRTQYTNTMQARGMANGQGTWQHDASHRQGVGYGDAKTAQQYNRGTSPSAASRDAYRGQPGSGGGGAAGTRPAQGASAQQSGTSGAFGGYTNGSTARAESARGQQSRQSYSGGASRGGGGGSRGGRR